MRLSLSAKAEILASTIPYRSGQGLDFDRAYKQDLSNTNFNTSLNFWEGEETGQ